MSFGILLVPQHGITVINPRQEQDLRSRKPLELQKLDKIHRVCSHSAVAMISFM